MPGALQFAFAFVGLVLAAAFIAAALQPRSPIALALAMYIAAWCEVVLLGETLGALDAIGPTGYALGELIVLVAAASVWHVRGRPLPARPEVASRLAVRRHPIIAGLGAVVACAFAYQLFLVLTTPANNGDALKYHLPRAVTWLQEGHLVFEGSHVSRGIEFQPNAELGVLHTLVFLRNDGAAALPQLLAEVALLVAVAGAARRLGYSRPASLFAALITGCLTQIALQAVTVKNDLVVASFVVTAAYFFQGPTVTELALAGLAIGLALGTKLTASLAVPLLVLLTAATLPRRRWALAFGAACIGFLAVGAFSYVRNVIDVGNPLGDQPAKNIFKPDVTLAGTASTLARIDYKFIDLSGFRVRTSWLEPIEGGAKRVFEVLHIPANPPESAGFPFSFTVNVVSDVDHSFFGPLGILLIVPLSIIFSAAWPLRRVSARHGIHGLSLPAFALAVALTFRFSDEARYLIVPVALVLALAGSIYIHRRLAALVAALAALTLWFTHAYNVAKPTPFVGTPVWRLSTAQARGLGVAGMAEAITALDRLVPQRARLGTVLGGSAVRYPLYGPRLERHLVPLPFQRPLRMAERRGLQWVYVGASAPLPDPRPGWTMIRISDGGTLLRRERKPVNSL